MLQEKTAKYFLKYRHDGLEVTDRKLKVLLSGYLSILQAVRPAE